MTPLLLVLAALAGTPTWPEMRTAGWVHEATRTHAAAGTVEILSKTVAGTECFQGRAKVQLEPEIMFQVASDIEGAMRWSTAGVTDAATLLRTDTIIDYYQYLDLPGWTLSADRFWFLHGHVERAGGAVTFWWERLVDGGPYAAKWQAVKAAHPSALEPPVNVGAWVFTPVEGGTRVQYMVCSNVGGSIPTSLQNTATTHTLPDNVGDLVREATRRSVK
ncbi:MAG: hypothetical protein ABIO70_03255 [Pseudomonadota bacterium]